MQKEVALLYTNNEVSEKEIRKIIPFTKSSKNKIFMSKFNQASERSWKENIDKEI